MNYINLLDVLYPIGCLYFSTSDVSPATIIGGIWTAVTGNAMIGQGSGYAGDAYIRVNQLPAHHHTFRAGHGITGWDGSSPGKYLSIQNSSQLAGYWADTGALEKTNAGTQIIGDTGGGLDTTPTILEYISGIAWDNQRGDIVWPISTF